MRQKVFQPLFAFILKPYVILCISKADIRNLTVIISNGKFDFITDLILLFVDCRNRNHPASSAPIPALKTAVLQLLCNLTDAVLFEFFSRTSQYL